jgi:ubiquinone biosynthesis protein Coq4
MSLRDTESLDETLRHGRSCEMPQSALFIAAIGKARLARNISSVVLKARFFRLFTQRAQSFLEYDAPHTPPMFDVVWERRWFQPLYQLRKE